jgi:predicted phage-related endonuclease
MGGGLMLVRERIPLPVDAHGRRDEAAWHRLRGEDLTASNIGDVFGVGRDTALGVYLHKAGQGRVDRPTRYTRRGHILEPVVAAELLERWGDAAITLADVYLRGRSPTDPHLRIGATKDYDLIRGGERLVLEIKTVAPQWFRRTWRAGGRGPITPPLDHALQVRTQAMLDDADAGLLAGLVCDDAAEIHAFRIERVARLEEEICRRVSLFWAAFAAGVMPRLQYGREAKALDLLRRAARVPIPTSTDAELAALATTHAAGVRRIAEIEAELRAAEDRIRELMTDNTVIYLPDARRVTVGAFARGRRVKVSHA